MYDGVAHVTGCHTITNLSTEEDHFSHSLPMQIPEGDYLIMPKQGFMFSIHYTWKPDLLFVLYRYPSAQWRFAYELSPSPGSALINSDNLVNMLLSFYCTGGDVKYACIDCTYAYIYW